MFKEYVPHGYRSWYEYNRAAEAKTATIKRISVGLAAAVMSVSALWLGCFLDFISR